MTNTLRTTTVLASAALLGLQLASAAPASAGYGKTWEAPEVSYTKGNVFAFGDRAEVRAKYRCAPGTEGTHVWVSIKQGPGDLTAEGSSAIAKAHYDTNVEGFSEEVVCDGEWQRLSVPVVRHQAKGQLERGEAYVQFCFYAFKGEEVHSATLNRSAMVKQRGAAGAPSLEG